MCEPGFDQVEFLEQKVLTKLRTAMSLFMDIAQDLDNAVDEGACDKFTEKISQCIEQAQDPLSVLFMASLKTIGAKDEEKARALYKSFTNSMIEEITKRISL